MYRLSFRDLQWEPVFLQPQRFTIDHGARRVLGSSDMAGDKIRILQDQHKAVIGMPAGCGKISDAGYDQMLCLAAKIPVCDHVIFRGKVRILHYPSPEEQNGQEGLGLFFRDTLTLDPLTGYPYSNMAAAGFFRGKSGIIVREGITRDSIGRNRNTACSGSLIVSPSLSDKTLDIVLEKQGTCLTAAVTAEGDASDAGYENTVDEELLSSRDPEMMYLGFMAARGCEMEVDLDSVSVEYSSRSGSGDSVPILYVSPYGDSLGDGTQRFPLDLQSAIDRCRSGQEIRVLSGHYHLKEDLLIPFSNSGSCCSRKKITAENSTGERAVLDFCGSRNSFRIEGNYWDISGITVTCGFGFVIQGSHNRIHNCRAVSNLETGFLVRHRSNDGPAEHWPSYNEISDCISCLNKDFSQQNADGFACKIASGPGNRFIRCTAWMNADDGFDLFSKNREIGAVTLFECRSWLNGYSIEEGKLVKTRGNGNGFKLGGSGMAADHEAVGCEAVGNRDCGFTSNSNPHMRLSGCMAGNNSRNFVYYFTGPESEPVCITDNCLETDDPAFDPVEWTLEHILTGFADLRFFSSSDDKFLLKYSIREHNAGVIRDALSTVRQMIPKDKSFKPAVLIMCSSLYGGGAERVACRLANGLSGRFRVFYLFIRDKGQSYPLEPGIRTIAMPRFDGDFETIMADRAAFTAGLKELLDIRVSISFMFTMNKLNVRSPGKARIICSERNNPSKRDPEHMEEIESIYEAADHVVFQSETVRSLFSKSVREHSSVILNPVSVSCYQTGGSHRIVNVGRLTPQKNQAMLIRAFARFYRDHPGYTLSFYGEGESAADLQTLVQSLGLNDAVQFHGHVHDVHSAISDAEIFALSSDYEGLPNALLECMMMGFPCISTRCEGSVDVIQSGENGILVDVGSVDQMAAALALLADDASLRVRFGNMAQETSVRFLADNVLIQWEHLIEV